MSKIFAGIMCLLFAVIWLFLAWKEEDEDQQNHYITRATCYITALFIISAL